MIQNNKVSRSESSTIKLGNSLNIFFSFICKFQKKIFRYILLSWQLKDWTIGLDHPTKMISLES